MRIRRAKSYADSTVDALTKRNKQADSRNSFAGGGRRHVAARGQLGRGRTHPGLGPLSYQCSSPMVCAMARKPDAEAFRTITDARPDDETIPGLLILRTEGRKTFASVPSVAENLRRLVQAADPEVVVFDCRDRGRARAGARSR